MSRHETALVFSSVTLPDDASVGPFAIVGLEPDGPHRAGTVIGYGAVLRAHSIVHAGNQIGDRFHLGDGARLREDNDVGDDVSVGARSVVEHHVQLGSSVRLHSNVFVAEHTTIEDGAWVGPGAVITNSRYPGAPRSKESLEPAVLGVGCRIGAGAIVLPGVHVGVGALIGAGAVVSRDVPAGAVVRGDAARVAGRVEDLDAYR